MKIDWTKVATMAGAVVVGIIIHKLVVKALGMSDATETMLGASGDWGCQADNSPTFPVGSTACQHFACCENSGGVVDYTSNGDGSGSIDCIGGSLCQGQGRVTVSEPVRRRKARRTFSF